VKLNHQAKNSFTWKKLGKGLWECKLEILLDRIFMNKSKGLFKFKNILTKEFNSREKNKEK